MSVLQTALLIIGALAVIAIYLFSRREKSSLNEWSPPTAPNPLKPPSADQMEMFNPSGVFDELGVGRPRKRSEPSLSAEPAPVPQKKEPQVALEVAAARVPSFLAAPKPAPVEDPKIIALLIAEREGTSILGQRLHQVLQGQGLVFGERKIYHRMDRDQPLFSVASLLKPGTLDPVDADSFTTPGLTIFMVLPGPQDPNAALRQLLQTAKALAVGLNAELFDDKRQPFSAASERAMIADVENWALRRA